ncbi:MAG: site-specific DNA-methyltransferase [Candidatus Zixiibacteriota bacterium]|nr:MAG: site-specific DNA-methyltransferase [candidate division Zixibacteria bacterium]
MAEISAEKTQLYNEDCLTGMAARLTPASVDVVVTSPPYNIGVKYGSYHDRMPLQEYLGWLGQWGKAVRRVLKDDGSLFLNVGSRPSAPLVPFQVLDTLISEFHLQNVIHWIKSIYIEAGSYGRCTEINVGHYKPINSERFLNDTHEYIFHLTKTGRVKLDRLALGIPYKDRTNISRWKAGKSRIRCRGNCWFIPYQTIQNRSADRPHPASYPPLLAEQCIRLHGLRGRMLVLDPFLGIGNTALACRKLGVRFVGFEIDPHYFQVAGERITVGGE